MQIKNQHIIKGKWVDCKSAIPVSEMKLIELRGREELKELGLPEFKPDDLIQNENSVPPHP